MDRGGSGEVGTTQQRDVRVTGAYYRWGTTGSDPARRTTVGDRLFVQTFDSNSKGYPTDDALRAEVKSRRLKLKYRIASAIYIIKLIFVENFKFESSECRDTLARSRGLCATAATDAVPTSGSAGLTCRPRLHRASGSVRLELQTHRLTVSAGRGRAPAPATRDPPVNAKKSQARPSKKNFTIKERASGDGGAHIGALRRGSSRFRDYVSFRFRVQLYVNYVAPSADSASPPEMSRAVRRDEC
ncbi:hypothetical protein EVAR_43480_1 [Eumeta japonica]|uniref:Uncharacterized protein n=1 Tax=Eumeta variegata TaxID=151549 RepID=A0A4C1YKQ6_EUMVA|nr:hypothetical protein EVAR_43480_1 [Eumeta japonica]